MEVGDVSEVSLEAGCVLDAEYSNLHLCVFCRQCGDLIFSFVMVTHACVLGLERKCLPYILFSH